MRSLCIVSAIAAVGLTTPASAEQADPSTRQQIERITDAFAENWNKQDAAGIAGLFTKDGVIVTSNAKAVDTGPQEIEQHFQNVFKAGITHNQGIVEQVSPFGTDAVIVLGEYHLSGQGQNGPVKLDGHWSAVDVRDGSTWKIRLLTAVPNPPSATSSAAATPSGPAR